MNDFSDEINKILKLAGVQLNEDNEYIPFILPDPSYKQFHDFFRISTYGKISAIIDNGHIYCWDSGYAHHGRMIKYIEQSLGVKISNDSIWVRFKEPNLCWVSAEYFNEYDDDELVDLPEQEFEKNLENNPIIRKYYPNGVKIIRFDRIDESVKLVNKEYGDTKLITTPFELNEYLKNHAESRFVYDVKKKWYLVGNSETSIHFNLLNDALVDGIYEPFEYNGEMITGMENDYKGGKILYNLYHSRFLLFRTSSDELNGEDYYYDRYRYCYIYQDYCIFDRNQDFQKTSLYKVLGEPLDVNFIGDIDADEGLTESIAYAEMNDDEMMVILHNPTRKELKDNNLDDECRIVNDGNGGYYFASSQWTHEQIENKLKSKNLPYEETMGEFYYYQDNLFATRDDWDTEEEYQEYKNDWYKSLKSMPYIVDNFGNFNAEIFNGEYLTEEIIHAEKSNYDDYMAVVLKNPTKRELRENGLYRSRFICFEDGTWLFFDSMQWIHEQILSKYRSNSRSVGMGFYDYNTNEFIFMESMNHDEGEEGYDEEVSYYENKCKKWLLTKPYIRETFGLNPNVTVYGDWVDNPW